MTKFIDAVNVLQEYGGQVAGWVKKTSSSNQFIDGTQQETHWVENVNTGLRILGKKVIDFIKW